MKSWKTTLFGATGIVTIGIGVVNALVDGNPATNPDWTVVIGALTACFAGLFARDNNVTSEEAGAK